MPKKILIFSLSYYPKYVGGAEVAIKEITDRIDPGDIEFHMVTNRYDTALPKIEKIGNVTIHRIGLSSNKASLEDLDRFPLKLTKYFFQFWAAIVALRLHHRYRFNGVWAMLAHSSGIPAGIFKLFNPRVPYILTLGEGDPTEDIERLARPVWPLFKRGFVKADKVQAVSAYLAKWARRMGHDRPVEIIPNGVDIDHFSRTDRLNESDNPDDIILVTTSRLVRKNGVDLVIRALTLLPEHIKFTVYGLGPEEAKLRQLSVEMKVDRRVYFAGHIDHADMPAALKACDIFVRTSRSEGMGISFIEAMAAGLPVIGTRVGGIGEFIFDPRDDADNLPTGWLVETESPVSIAETVLHIVKDPDRASAVAENALDMVRRKYDWDAVTVLMKERVFSVSG